MRDLLRILIVGIVLFFSGFVYAGDYNVLIIPDNIVTESETVDSYIYNEAAEFFANEITALLNQTDNIKTSSTSEIRTLFKKDPSTYLIAKKLTDRFKTSYNIDSVAINKLAKKTGSRYVLLITSYIDHENYILRRTLWDFLNIPGATVVDPAYKISTYALLFDTKRNLTIWTNTYYKTISICENRIITRGPSPQVEQLEKIRDYSRTICPQIAQSVQMNILPPEIFVSESKKIVDDMGNLDNVFTKKYRQYIKSTKKKMDFKDNANEEKGNVSPENNSKTESESKQTTKLEVKAQPVKETDITTKKSSSQDTKTKDTVLKKDIDTIYNKQDTYPINIYQNQTFDIKKTKTNSLINNTKNNPPSIRNYSL